MESSLNKLSPGAQYGMVIGICVVVLILGWFMLLKGQKEEIARKNDELDQLQVEINKANSLKKQLQEFEVELESLQLKLNTLVKILPSEKDVEVLIQRIEHQARASDLDLKQFDPRDTINHDFYAEWPIYMSFHGGYHELAKFFDKTSKFDRIININDLSMQALRGRNASARHSISATCTATTFVFID